MRHRAMLFINGVYWTSMEVREFRHTIMVPFTPPLKVEPLGSDVPAISNMKTMVFEWRHRMEFDPAARLYLERYDLISI